MDPGACTGTKAFYRSGHVSVDEEQVKIQWFWTRARVEQPKHFIVPDAYLCRTGEIFYCSGRVSAENRQSI